MSEVRFKVAAEVACGVKTCSPCDFVVERGTNWWSCALYGADLNADPHRFPHRLLRCDPCLRRELPAEEGRP